MDEALFERVLMSIQPGDTLERYSDWAYQALTSAVKVAGIEGDFNVVAMRIAACIAFELKGTLSICKRLNKNFIATLNNENILQNLRPAQRLTVEAINRAISLKKTHCTPISSQAITAYLHICSIANNQKFYAHSTNIINPIRNRLIIEERKGGKSVREISKAWSLAITTIYEILKKAGSENARYR